MIWLSCLTILINLSLSLAQGIHMPHPPSIVSTLSETWPYHAHPQYQKLTDLLAHYQKYAHEKASPLSSSLQDEQNLQALAHRLMHHKFLSLPILASQRDVIHALKKFQKAHGLSPSGNLNKATLAKLNEPLHSFIDLIQRNLKRLKAIKSFRSQHIIVNIPSFFLHAFRDSNEIFSTPVVVGKIDSPTPQFNAFITHIVTHPTWFIPANMTEKLRGNIGSRGYAWSNGTLIQKPGPHNPLGNIKFLVRDGASGILLHSTNKPHLFDQKRRADSLGCIRIKDTQALTEFLLENNQVLQEVQEALSHKKSRTIPLIEDIPLHVVYLTAWVDDQGYPQFFDDLYEYDQDEEE